MKLRIWLLMMISLFSILVIIILYYLSIWSDGRSNAFKRLFPPHVVVLSKSWDMKSGNWYLAGASTQYIFMGNKQYINYVAEIDMKGAADIKWRTIYFSDGDNIPFTGAILDIEPPDFYLTDGSLPAIFKGDMKDWHIKTVDTGKIYFDNAIPVSNGSYLIRMLGEHGFTLGKKLKDGVQLSDSLLTRQIDGIVCKDGMLHYDKNMSKVIYVYFYRNQFVVADSSLNLLYNGTTIDTVSFAKVKLGNPDKNGAITMARKPVLTNRLSAVYNGRLFIHSGLKADNEREDLFEKAAVIDVYDLNKGRYKWSFYIPDYKNIRLRHFKIVGDKLIAQHGKYVLLYHLNQ